MIDGRLATVVLSMHDFLGLQHGIREEREDTRARFCKVIS